MDVITHLSMQMTEMLIEMNEMFRGMEERLEWIDRENIGETLQWPRNKETKRELVQSTTITLGQSHNLSYLYQIESKTTNNLPSK